MIRAYVLYALAAALLSAVWWRCGWTWAALCLALAWIAQGVMDVVRWRLWGE